MNKYSLNMMKKNDNEEHKELNIKKIDLYNDKDIEENNKRKSLDKYKAKLKNIINNIYNDNGFNSNMHKKKIKMKRTNSNINLFNKNMNINKKLYKNKNMIKKSNSKIKKINLKSTLNILTKKEIRINMSEKKQLMNHESNTFNQLFKYFEKKGKNSIKKIITERENKKNKYFNNIENNYIQFPYGSNNREEAKIKIKQIENDTVSINAQKLYNKNKYSKSRQNINKTYFSNELLVEKYDQKRLYNIISKIMEDKNKKIKK
jgi:hypothetical protein